MISVTATSCFIFFYFSEFFYFRVAFSLFKYLGAGICIGDTCFWSFIVQSECFSFFLRSPQVDELLWIWDRGVAFGGPIVVPAGVAGCCCTCGCAGPHWRGACSCGFSVCLWSGWLLFRYPGTLLARLDITNFITKPLTRMGIYVVAIFFGVPGGLGVAV